MDNKNIYNIYANIYTSIIVTQFSLFECEKMRQKRIFDESWNATIVFAARSKQPKERNVCVGNSESVK